jgi:hypothetical protein
VFPAFRFIISFSPSSAGPDGRVEIVHQAVIGLLRRINSDAAGNQARRQNKVPATFVKTSNPARGSQPSVDLVLGHIASQSSNDGRRIDHAKGAGLIHVKVLRDGCLL